MDNRQLPPAHRLARLMLAIALVASFGAAATAAVATGWATRMIADGQDVVERARTMWSGS